MFVLIVACRKQSTNLITCPKVEENLKKDDFFVGYSLNKEQLIENANNPEDEANNQKLFSIAEDLKEVLAAFEVKRKLLDMIRRNKRNHIRLADAIGSIPELEKVAELKNLKEESFKLPYLGVMHEVVINVPNIEVADASQSSLISPGIEVPDEETKGIDDFIFSWYFDESELKFREVAIGEEQAMIMSNPLFVITPHPEVERNDRNNVALEGRAIDIDFFEAPEVDVRSAAELRLKLYQVKNPYYFEKTGKLEWNVAVYLTYFNSSNFQPNWSYVREKKISRSDVASSKLFATDDFMSNPDPGAFTNPYGVASDIYILTWEEDWYASAKDVSCSCSSCQHATCYILSPHMKYSNEYYNKTCGPGTAFFPVIGDAVDSQNYKGRVKVERTQ